MGPVSELTKVVADERSVILVRVDVHAPATATKNSTGVFLLHTLSGGDSLT